VGRFIKPMGKAHPCNQKKHNAHITGNYYLLPNFSFMSKERTVQKATKKEPAKSLKEKQADKKAKKESKKYRP
jgi:hypothetical protein